MYGRIARQWDLLAQLGAQQGRETRLGEWTNRAIRLCWRFGLEMWRRRIQIVHGTIGGVSRMKRDRVTRLIERIHAEILPVVIRGQRAVFEKTEEEVQKLSY